MNIRDKLSKVVDSEDDDTETSTDTGSHGSVAGLRAGIQELAEEIHGTRYPAETNRDLAKTVANIAEATSTITGSSLRYPRPDENPRTEDLATALANTVDALDAATGENTGDMPAEAVAACYSHIETATSILEDADTLPYEIHEFDVNTQYQKPLQSVCERTDLDRDEVPASDREEIYAGPRVREKFERASVDPDQPLWVGTGTRSGRDASIEKHHLRRHLGVFGVTGHGKSTFLVNEAVQLAEAGSGLCFIDPKGDDSERLIEVLPEDRLDDVVWLEPGGEHEYISGFNFINVGLSPDDPNFDTALSALIEDLVKLLGAGDYWGPRMDRVFRTIVRAMNEYNQRFPEKKDLNLVDLYYILQSPESRHEFHYRIKSAGIHFVEDYLEDIAAFDDDDLEPLLGRFQKWVQDRLARRMIGFRDSEVNIQDVVESGKILIVRMGGQPKELKRMLGMAVLRRIWSTIRARAAVDEWERDQFYTIVDEFDNVAKQGEAIPTMLSESRSLGMGLTFCCQYPAQLPDDVVDAMMVNCDTMLSFNPGARKQAKIIAPKIGKDVQPLLDESPFHLWMRVTLDATNERSDPFRVYTHPPFPPRRGRDERDDLILESLQQYGKPEPTDEEEKRALLYKKGSGPWESGMAAELVAALEEGEKPLIEMARADLAGMYDDGELVSNKDTASTESSSNATASGGTASEQSDAEQLVEAHETDLMEGIWAARLQAGLEPGETVPYDAAASEIERRVGDTGYLSELSNAIEKLPSDYVTKERRDGDLHLGLTAAGRGEVTRQDTGSSGSGGGEDHRWVLSQVFASFTRLGYVTTLPEQEGEEQPDGLSEAPIEVTDVDEDLSPSETMAAMEERRDELREQYPGVWNLAGADNVSIEAETSTFTYPFQTFRNLGKAMARGDLCVFATKDGTADHDDFGHYGRRLEQVLYDTTGPLRGGNKTIHHDRLTLMKHRDDEDRERFYTEGNHYKVDGNAKALRPARDDEYDSTAWYRDPETGEIVACYSKSGRIPDDGEFARFEDATAVVEAGRQVVPAYYEYDQSEGEYVVYTSDGEKKFYPSEEELEADWERFNKPYIPEVDLPEMPSEDDFLIVIYPDDDNPEYDQPQVYEAGETTPLFEYANADTDTTTTTSETTVDPRETEQDTESVSEPPTEPDAEVSDSQSTEPTDAAHNAPSDTTESGTSIDTPPTSFENVAVLDGDLSPETVDLDREHPPTCPACSDQRAMTPLEVGQNTTNDETDEAAGAIEVWHCLECGEVRRPRKDVDEPDEDPADEQRTSSGRRDLVENRLSPGALAAKTMLDTDRCASILDGSYQPRREHRDGLRSALETLRPEEASPDELPPVFDTDWFNENDRLNSGSDHAIDHSDDEPEREAKPDASAATNPASEDGIGEQDETDGRDAMAEARAVAGEEEQTPTHRDSMDAVVDPSDSSTDSDQSTEAESEAESETTENQQRHADNRFFSHHT